MQKGPMAEGQSELAFCTCREKIAIPSDVVEDKKNDILGTSAHTIWAADIFE